MLTNAPASEPTSLNLDTPSPTPTSDDDLEDDDDRFLAEHMSAKEASLSSSRSFTDLDEGSAAPEDECLCLEVEGCLTCNNQHTEDNLAVLRQATQQLQATLAGRSRRVWVHVCEQNLYDWIDLCPPFPLDVSPTLTRRQVHAQIKANVFRMWDRISVGPFVEYSDTDWVIKAAEEHPYEAIVPVETDVLCDDDLIGPLDGKILYVDYKATPIFLQLTDKPKFNPLLLREGQGELKKGQKLTECVEKLTQPEQLSDQDAWYCRKCKAHQRVSLFVFVSVSVSVSYYHISCHYS